MDTVTRSECINTHNITNQKMDKMSDKIDRMAIELASLPEKLVEKLDDRYASKKTEENLVWVTRLVIGSLIVAVIGLIIKNK